MTFWDASNAFMRPETKNRKLGSSGCWFVVYIRRFIYKYLNVCPFDYMAVAGSGKVGP